MLKFRLNSRAYAHAKKHLKNSKASSARAVYILIMKKLILITLLSLVSFVAINALLTKVKNDLDAPRAELNEVLSSN